MVSIVLGNELLFYQRKDNVLINAARPYEIGTHSGWLYIVRRDNKF